MSVGVGRLAAAWLIEEPLFGGAGRRRENEMTEPGSRGGHSPSYGGDTSREWGAGARRKGAAREPLICSECDRTAPVGGGEAGAEGGGGGRSPADPSKSARLLLRGDGAGGGGGGRKRSVCICVCVRVCVCELVCARART